MSLEVRNMAMFDLPFSIIFASLIPVFHQFIGIVPTHFFCDNISNFFTKATENEKYCKC
jgi:ABC-type protease/lipase transport system fused ATPase/permease subunit